MAYGLSASLFVENGPANQAAKARAARSTPFHIGWRSLAGDRRIELVEQALRAPANDIIDEYPIAL